MLLILMVLSSVHFQGLANLVSCVANAGIESLSLLAAMNSSAS